MAESASVAGEGVLVEETVDFGKSGDMVEKAAKKNGKYTRTTRSATTPEAAAAAKAIELPPKSGPAALLEKVVNNPDYEFIGTQISPDYMENIQLPRGNVQTLRAWLRTKFKGGNFRVQILQNGEPIPEDKNGILSISIPLSDPVSKLDLGDEEDPVKRAKKEEAEIKAKENVSRARFEAEAAEAEREKKRNTQSSGPLEKMLEDLRKQNENLNAKIEEERKERERDRAAAAAKAAEPKTDTFLEMMKLVLPALVANLTTPKPPDTTAKEIAAAMKESAAVSALAMKENMAMMEKMQERQLAAIEKSSKSDPVKQLLELADLQEKLMPKERDDDRDEINPKHGMSNLWLVAKWAIAAVKEGGAALPALLASMSQQTGMSPQELALLAKNPPPGPGLPAPRSAQPQGRPAVFNPAGASMPTAAPFIPPPPGPEDFLRPTPALKIVKKPAAALSSAQPPEHSVSVPSAASLETPPPQASGGTLAEYLPLPGANPIEADLNEKVNAVAKEMLFDLSVERAEHQWIDAALALWHKSFLDQLSATTDQDARADLIGARVNKALWFEIRGQFLRGGNWYNTMLALNGLVEGHAEEQAKAQSAAAHAAAQAPATVMSTPAASVENSPQSAPVPEPLNLPEAVQMAPEMIIPVPAQAESAAV